MIQRSSDHHNPLSNQQVAELLEEIAGLLESQNANPFRVRSYREAANTLRQLEAPVSRLLDQEGLAGLIRLPRIGRSLARSIEQLTWTGRLALLERLRGDMVVERLFATVPGIGADLAARIHECLGIETLAELQAAAYDGRLAEVPGLGPRRVRAVRESLAGRFRRQPPLARVESPQATGDQPPVSELLSIDQEYRQKSAAGRLVRVAPLRFNPRHEAWLPILHTTRGPRHYTALFSNTARAHELGTTNDWVVIYRDDSDGHGQWTVIDSRFGRLKGKRIVRGREAECAAYYEQLPSQPMLIDDCSATTNGFSG